MMWKCNCVEVSQNCTKVDWTGK